MSDLIDRQAAIEDIRTMIPKDAQFDIKWIEMWLKQLPAAQPEPCDDAVDRAEIQTALQFAARRYTVAHEAHGEGRVVWSDDLISVSDAMNALREVPAAQPEQKKGKWINGKCSECGEHAPFWCMASTYHESNYCPNCGSYNGGDEE